MKEAEKMSASRQDCHAPDKDKFPVFGPLQIQNEEGYLQDGAKRFANRYVSSFPYRVNIETFDLLLQLGKGAFGTVILVKDKKSGTFYAMKTLNKKDLVEKHRVKKALNEKLILQSVNCPFTVNLLYFTQDKSNIYFILPFISGGELFTRLTKVGKFSENLSKFYAAQIILAFEYLHNCCVVFRDLKLENILIDHYGYIKITDFGFAKVVRNRTYSFCGTPDYLAPEIVLGRGYGKAVDWWAFGVLIFEMSSGQPPFFDPDDYNTVTNIINVQYEMPKSFNKDLKDLIKHLLQRDVTKRLGNLKSGTVGLKMHSWFKSIQWLPLLNRVVVPPFVPTDSRIPDNFPKMKTAPILKTAINDEFQKHFSDF